MLAGPTGAPALREPPRTKFLLSSIGTLGDLFPILELARELVARGQLCHMLGSASGAAAAAQLGVEYTVVAPTQTNNLAGKKAVFETSIFPSYREIQDANRAIGEAVDQDSATLNEQTYIDRQIDNGHNQSPVDANMTNWDGSPGVGDDDSGA